jgi:protein TonB
MDQIASFNPVEPESQSPRTKSLFGFVDRHAFSLAVGLSVVLHIGSIAYMNYHPDDELVQVEKPKVAKVRIFANPNGNPNVTQTKVVEIAKPKPKPKTNPNLRSIATDKPKEAEQPQEDVANNAPQSFGDDPTGGVVGTGFSTTDGSSDPGANSNAEPIERVKPSFPQEAQLKGIEGWVMLRFDITEEGRVENIQVVDANPRNLFEREARNAVKKWKYAPRLANGQSVKVVGREVQIDFKFDN